MVVFRYFFISLLYVISLANASAFSTNDTILKSKSSSKNPFANVAPILTATGNQLYCPGNSVKIVTNMVFTDPDDSGIDAVYIQISSGYVNGQDVLTLTGFHPTITSTWDAVAGKLTLTGVASVQPTYLNLENAIEDIEFSNNSVNPSGTRNFSITVGQANYLPSNGHYYQYIPSLGITWNNARLAAQNSFYYGLQGYLATITSMEEAQISGEQASGAGWIGGSDEETEGVWKWMTGPEVGLVFWNGAVNGSTPNFEYWNNGEPNNDNDEDYAHITAPGVGILGSWNDLSNVGGASGNYQPKGYIVEYGGTLGDPVLQIATSTTLTIPSITTTVAGSRCGAGSVNLIANAANGTVTWYASATGVTPIATGNTFTTPMLTATTTYYATAFATSCTTGSRIAVVATINQIPMLTVANPTPICENSTAVLSATATAGIVSWYDAPTGGLVYATGLNFTTPLLTQTTTFYVEALNNGCSSGSRIPVTVVVNSLPIVSDESVIFCENTSITLDAGVTNSSYLWSNGATSQTISVSTPINYSVLVTNAQNCSKNKTIAVIQHEIPEIERVVVNETLVTIIANGFGDYEYSVDGVFYQDSNVFIVPDGGLYIAYVRSKRMCGDDKQQFVVLTIPKFFTPNNDGVNDTFFVKGMIYFPEASAKIFDRFGKLVAVINASKASWDGNYKGLNLPSSDYWYIIYINDSLPEIKGHFSMKR